jgi:hypothetical protein
VATEKPMSMGWAGPRRETLRQPAAAFPFNNTNKFIIDLQ